MKTIALITILVFASGANILFAHDIGSDGKYFFRRISGEAVETGDFLITIEYADGYAEDTPHYQVVLKTKADGVTNTAAFPMEGGRIPHLTAFNEAYYCDKRFIFVTLSFPIPRYADIRQHIIYTHAFDAQTLSYLDTAFAPFERIAPHEDGADLGFPYEMPQPFRVYCSITEGSFNFDIKSIADGGG